MLCHYASTSPPTNRGSAGQLTPTSFSAGILPYNFLMPRILYTAFDIVPSPKGASTHILHNIRGLVNGRFDVHLITPNDGVLPTTDTIEDAQVTRITQDLT